MKETWVPMVWEKPFLEMSFSIFPWNPGVDSALNHSLQWAKSWEFVHLWCDLFSPPLSYKPASSIQKYLEWFNLVFFMISPILALCSKHPVIGHHIFVFFHNWSETFPSNHLLFQGFNPIQSTSSVFTQLPVLHHARLAFFEGDSETKRRCNESSDSSLLTDPSWGWIQIFRIPWKSKIY